jgi:hypothetical protein
MDPQPHQLGGGDRRRGGLHRSSPRRGGFGARYGTAQALQGAGPRDTSRFFEDEYRYDRYHDSFDLARLWFDSANWTRNAQQSGEWGMWSVDPVLLINSYERVVRVIKASEPLRFHESERGVDPGEARYRDWSDYERD